MADPAQPIAAAAAEDDELANFREQWRQEVQGRKRQQQEDAQGNKPPQATSTSLGRNSTATQDTVEQLPPRDTGRPRGILDAERTEDQKITRGILQDEVELARAIGSMQIGSEPIARQATTVTVTQEPRPSKAHGKPLSPKPKHAAAAQPTAAQPKSTLIKDHPPHTTTSSTTKRAVEAYSQAIDLESSGQLNEALHLYRKAYKLDDRVDKAYHSAVVHAEATNRAHVVEIQVVDPAVVVQATPPPLEPYVFMTHTQLAPDYHPRPAGVRPGQAAVAAADTHAEWQDPLTRIIATFPEDLYLVDFTPEEEKWPCLLSVLPDEVVENIAFFLDVQSLERFARACKKARLVTRVAPVWKYLCEKIYRPPLLPLEIKPVDLATRHGFDWRSTFLEEQRVRYDGLYISVCHYIPVDVVHSVRPSLRAKGTLFGQWGINTIKDSKGRDSPRIELRSLLEPGLHTPKYEFEMDLCLKTTTRGRWDKVDMLTYQSINLVNGEALGLSLKHQKPFYFSK
ncbi:hypothetical protein QFC21_004047 [Naganishia friedmannii]|uniref:Uncharacterized protein n=1 Tax=Naganishia friedmannii TaxID=89922 RepID=A0ACC2VKT6_9TREE|nr:hypothetical protein QFC21_004047 [Naganishia friedmannii]